MGADDRESLLDGPLRQALLETLLSNSDSYFACVDRQRKILFLSRTLSRDRGAVVGRHLEEFVAPANRDAMIACVERAFTEQAPAQLEFEVLLADQSRRHMLTKVVPFQGPSAEPFALLITDDDTQRRRLSEELERSQEFQRRVVGNLPGFVSLVDRQYRFVWVNRLAPGLTLQDVIGTPVDRYIEPNDVERMHNAVDTVIATGKPTHYESEGYGDGVAPSSYLVRVEPVRVAGKVDTVLMLTTDVSELKRAEQALRDAQEQLHQAQRLESIGQLAGGIAHDFNNLLQVIAGNVSFARQAQKSGRSAVGELEQALRATERAAELTAHLLAVGRRQRVDSKRLDLGQLVSESVRMLRRTIPESIALHCDVVAECFVELDPPQFEQVLMNLCINARDAMPNGGQLNVRVEPRDDDRVLLSVTDTGTGIPRDSLQRVFEPFFTTKGAGSGLGLAVAAGIVAAHGGTMEAHSDGVHGTTMHVILPRTDAAPIPKPLSSTPDAGGQGLILVAEDEEAVRMHVVRVLEQGGYTVLEADNGARAVRLLEEHPGQVDLAVLDVVMPVMDGWRAFLKMRELQPDLKVLFTTGYAADVLPDDFASYGARLLSKPFNPSQLLAHVRELLEQPLHVA